MTDYGFQLLSKQQKLDDALHMELRRMWPDTLHILKLRRLKLAVKQQFAALLHR